MSMENKFRLLPIKVHTNTIMYFMYIIMPSFMYIQLIQIELQQNYVLLSDSSADLITPYNWGIGLLY